MKNSTHHLLKRFYLAFSFFLVDVSLRVITRWLGYYSIYKIAPSLFSLCWSIIIASLLGLLRKRIGRIIYGIIYSIFSVYAIAQFMYYSVFDRFLFLPDLKYASEGADFVPFIGKLVNGNVIRYVGFLTVVCILGVVFFPDRIKDKKRRVLAVSLSSVVACGIITCVPKLYQFDDNSIF